ncbi:hypothetical protein ACFX13_031590 [Malus domestica]
MPKLPNDVELMSFSKILENNVTVGQCKLPLVDIGWGIVMMRVVVQPAMGKSKTVVIGCVILITLYSGNFQILKLVPNHDFWSPPASLMGEWAMELRS